MKKLVILLLFIPLVSLGQDFKTQDKIMSVVFQVDSLSASEIHSRALNAIANIYNNANNVIQLNDTQANKIVVKGSSTMTITNPIKALYPKNKYIKETSELFYDHTINIDSKDNRYRIVYIVSNPEELFSTTRIDFASPIFSFEEPKQDGITEYVDLKMSAGTSLLGKKKKAIYKSALLKLPKEIVNTLINDTKSILLMINDGIQQQSVMDKNSILNEDF